MARTTAALAPPKATRAAGRGGAGGGDAASPPPVDELGAPPESSVRAVSAKAREELAAAREAELEAQVCTWPRPPRARRMRATQIDTIQLPSPLIRAPTRAGARERDAQGVPPVGP